MFGIFGKKCPRCGKRKINVVKPSLLKRAAPASMFLLFGPFALFMKQPKTYTYVVIVDSHGKKDKL
jgi:hypothetical protein